MENKFIVVPDALDPPKLVVINVSQIVKVEEDIFTKITLKDQSVEYTILSIDEVYTALKAE